MGISDDRIVSYISSMMMMMIKIIINSLSFLSSSMCAPNETNLLDAILLKREK